MKVVPRSGSNRLAGWVGERLKVCVTAPPEKGRANEAVVELLAEVLGLSKRNVRIVRGETTPQKTVEIQGINPAGLQEKISSLIPRS